jgi:dihydrofolate synthase/folylpolyglutamate synthase
LYRPDYFHVEALGKSEHKVFDLPKYGDGICLARLTELLDALAVDRIRLARISVVVTGSNGKGSTAALCASIGHAYGLRTGLFTSPHLFELNERFQIDGRAIGDDDLMRLKSRIEPAIADISQRRGERFGQFEALFALACLYFQESHCDFAVFEAGIGGRYDPVRLVGARLTCVTSVDYEHVELLGPSLELIAADKSDACAPGGTIIYGENLRDLKPYLLDHTRLHGITAFFVCDEIEISGESLSPVGQRFDFAFGSVRIRSLDMNLLGAFQFNNAAIAISLFLLWLEDTPSKKTGTKIEAAVRSGLRNTRWPGRLEIIRQAPLTIVDVGHTPDGIKQALASLKAIYGRENWILVVGVSLDKKAREIVSALAPSFDTILCTAAYHKGMDATSIAAAAHEANPSADIEIATTIEDAVSLSRSLAISRNRRIYVAGGLFVSVEYAAVTRGGRARDLNFL